MITPNACFTSVFVAVACLCPLVAQASEVASENPAELDYVLPVSELPKEIYGVPCILDKGNADLPPMLRCEAKDPMKDPSISVGSRTSACTATLEETKEFRRKYMNDGTPFANVVWVRSFVPESVPGGRGFTGFYQKSLGNRYWWEVCGQGRMTTVLVIMFAPLDNEALKADVEMKVFGVAPQNQSSNGN